MTTPLLNDFPELADLSREDLEDLLNDPMYFQSVFYSLSRVKAMVQEQAELGMANEAIAKNNLALEESLHKLRRDTQEAFSEAKALEARWKELEREQREAHQRYTPQFLLMRLRHATTAQDEASETLATAFVRGESSASTTSSSRPSPHPSPLPHLGAGLGDTSTTILSGTSGAGTLAAGREVDEFVKEFKDARKKYHKRAMWVERWSTGQVAWRDD